ncbi:hypothetical protein [Bordetella bronchiseptica]|uniref:hypothetical protein n=1 Tax=Bordetella bronchiseptica TaxID=518 RepID=UPI0005B4E1DB|nr:hypothetical protein [Bordetella bronchiseptica]
MVARDFQGRVKDGWRVWGERAFVVAGGLWLGHQFLAMVDAHETLCQFLGDHEHLQLDELLVLALLVLPVICVLWWRTGRRLEQEIVRRKASDALAVIMRQVDERTQRSRR